MYKISGFDPAHDDWFWLKNDPAGAIEVEGKVDSCTGCHAGAADFDYLWTLKNDRQ